MLQPPDTQPPTQVNGLPNLSETITGICSWQYGTHTLLKGNIQKLEMVQWRAARFTLNRYRKKSSITDMLNELGWPSLEERREKHRLIMLYKIRNGLVAVNMWQEPHPSKETNTPQQHPGILNPTVHHRLLQIFLLPQNILPMECTTRLYSLHPLAGCLPQPVMGIDVGRQDICTAHRTCT